MIYKCGEDLKEIVLTENITFTHPFTNKYIVFTGALTGMTRSSAAKLATQCGAIIQGAVSARTDFLILGAKRRGISSKHQTAIRLQQQHEKLQIIEEEDFYWLLSMNKEQ